MDLYNNILAKKLAEDKRDLNSKQDILGNNEIFDLIKNEVTDKIKK